MTNMTLVPDESATHDLGVMGRTGTAVATDVKCAVGRNERQRPRTLAKRPCSLPTRFPGSVSLSATEWTRCSQRSV